MSGRAGRGSRGRWRWWGGTPRRIAGLALLMAAVALPLLMRAAWEGRAELAEAEAAAQRGRVDLEIVHLGRAARWRVPFAGHDEAALARLMAVAAAAEATGDAGSQTALMACREARAALLATRAWSSTDMAVYQAANRKIAATMAMQEQVFGTDLSGRGDAEGYHLALLEAARPTQAPWASLAGVALLVAVIGLGIGAPGRGGLRALLVGAGVVLAVIAWSLGPG